MESKAHYALIGTLVIVFLVAAMSAVLWLSGSNLDQSFDEYTVTFNGPIRGMQEAAEVRFNGIKVGEVTALRLDPDDPNKVLVRIEVFSETPVDTSSYAQLEPQGLTGLNIIQLFSGGSNFPLLKDMPGRGPYIIEGRESQINSLIAGGGTIVESVQRALQGVETVLSDESLEDFAIILQNISAITTEYRENPITAKRIEQTLAGIDQASADVSIASLSVDVTARDTTLLVNEQIKPIVLRLNTTLDEVETTLRDTQALLKSAQNVAVSTDGVVTDFSQGALRDIEAASATLNDLMLTLNRVADELERNPTQFIAGEDREVMELPQ